MNQTFSSLEQLELLFCNPLKIFYKISKFSNQYEEFMKEIKIDKNQIYNEKKFIDIFSKIIFTLLKFKMYTDFEEFTKELLQFELKKFFLNILLDLIQKDFCDDQMILKLSSIKCIQDFIDDQTVYKKEYISSFMNLIDFLMINANDYISIQILLKKGNLFNIHNFKY